MSDYKLLIGGQLVEGDGTLEVINPGALEGLSGDEIGILYNMAARSAHPKSVAVRRALEGQPAARFMELDTEEHIGRGIYRHMKACAK